MRYAGPCSFVILSPSPGDGWTLGKILGFFFPSLVEFFQVLNATSAPERSSSGAINGGILFEVLLFLPKRPRLKLNLTEAELLVALHYVACSRTPTALNLNVST